MIISRREIHLHQPAARLAGEAGLKRKDHADQEDRDRKSREVHGARL